MSSQLFNGPEVSLPEMLDAREQRQATQLAFLKKEPKQALLLATMNIPGPVKNSPELVQLFHQVSSVIETSLQDVKSSANLFRNEKTGLEYYLLVPIAPLELKKRMIEIEEQHPLGRLFDLDVLYIENGELIGLSRQTNGLPRRRCFVCEGDAKECGRARKHTIAEMQAKIIEITQQAKV
ncbi:holo-ACP synthase [Enterococcus sp. PF1-24]|uniref:citrate lyase holo-[acyl-carrier protein] synthase n=1 Tax=unclassified Enterococcus TaxID=2608891 RepID=UPI0024767982|nr:MULTISPECIES: citrate lyase holo-[acyl-carrier protein] synthase [unclassified Enterococcus]MDH6365821.1 holo-ACP synthase [Enterococcus sp. PFB1-1]MDH6400757.1 holo-ACP synthase [Enterococcus sp. PF1-24]